MTHIICGIYNLLIGKLIISIMHKIKISTGRPFTAEQIWNKLESLYQLDMLDETEILNFQLCEKTHFRNLSKKYKGRPHMIAIIFVRGTIYDYNLSSKWD